jgi:hypothetical protein
MEFSMVAQENPEMEMSVPSGLVLLVMLCSADDPFSSQIMAVLERRCYPCTYRRPAIGKHSGTQPPAGTSYTIVEYLKR